jgi:hypothetical protein
MRVEFVVALSLALPLGCKESKPGEARTDVAPEAAVMPLVSAPAVEARGAEAPGTAGPLSSSLEETAFRIEFTAQPSVKVGEAFPILLKLAALNGYKVNQEYPLKFALDGAQLAFDPAILKKEQLTLEPKTAELKGKATATAKGELTLHGKLSFSVCTDERCLIEKREVAVKVNAV